MVPETQPVVPKGAYRQVEVERGEMLAVQQGVLEVEGLIEWEEWVAIEGHVEDVRMGEEAVDHHNWRPQRQYQ